MKKKWTKKQIFSLIAFILSCIIFYVFIVLTIGYKIDIPTWLFALLYIAHFIMCGIFMILAGYYNDWF